MKKSLNALGIVAILAALAPALAEAQEPATQKPAPADKPAAAVRSNPRLSTPIRLQFQISKYQGEKKISSLPYSIPVSANGAWASLRTGAQVPIMTSRVTEGKAVPTYTYKDVGVGIDCRASEIDGGQFTVEITVDDSSITATSPGQGNPDAPVFRHFRTSSNVVLLKDGQTTQLTTAADPISGEVMRIDVTLSVVK